ncbi:MAG: sigma-70 family RNA polymerase sigma factor, partial [Anaerovorax sp.]
NLDKFNCDSKFETWVYRIVVNTCNDFLRKNKDKPKNDNLFRSDEDGEYELEIKDHKPGPEEILQQKEEGTYILSCLNRLQVEHREALILRDIRGYSYEEISEILDCSLGTVKSRISRARQKLKDLYIQST